MECDRCGARIEGGAYPSDDEGSQDLCFDCAVADGAKNVAEAIQCAHGRRYGEPCPLQARVKELEEEGESNKVIMDGQRERIVQLLSDPKSAQAKVVRALDEISDQCAGMECGPDRCGGCEATTLRRILEDGEKGGA